MKNIYILILILFAQAYASAQVGINTNNPQSELHVVGDMQITSELKVGGSSAVPGSVGLNNQVLTSGGDGQAASWKNLGSALPIGDLVSSLQGGLNTTTVGGGVVVIAKYNASTDSFFCNNEYLTYNSATGKYTIVKSGFYRLYATTNMNIPDQSLTTEGWTKSFIKRGDMAGGESIILGQTTLSSHGYTPNVSQTLSGIDYFEAGDLVWLEYSRENLTLSRKATFSILFTGR